MSISYTMLIPEEREKKERGERERKRERAREGETREGGLKGKLKD